MCNQKKQTWTFAPARGTGPDKTTDVVEQNPVFSSASPLICDRAHDRLTVDLTSQPCQSWACLQVSLGLSPRLRQFINAGIFTPRVGRLGMPAPVVPPSFTIAPTEWEQEVRWKSCCDMILGFLLSSALIRGKIKSFRLVPGPMLIWLFVSDHEAMPPRPLHLMVASVLWSVSAHIEVAESQRNKAGPVARMSFYVPGLVFFVNPELCKHPLLPCPSLSPPYSGQWPPVPFRLQYGNSASPLMQHKFGA